MGCIVGFIIYYLLPYFNQKMLAIRRLFRPARQQVFSGGISVEKTEIPLAYFVELVIINIIKETPFVSDNFREEEKMDKKLRIGIIGCGGIANGKHMPSLK